MGRGYSDMEPGEYNWRDDVDTEGVVDARRPWRIDPVGGMSKSWSKKVAQANLILHEVLRHIGEGSFYVDEIALLFPYGNMKDFVLDACAGRGVQLFNTAHDVVEVVDWGTNYHVDYAFLSTDFGVRLETMQITMGMSPLHSAQAFNLDRHSFIGVHLSFKTEDISEYQQVVSELSVVGRLMQECQSSYGRFSYWSIPEITEGARLYLKPRVNLRDDGRGAVPVAPPLQRDSSR